MTTQHASWVVAELADALTDEGWTRRWAGVNIFDDEAGNAARIRDDDDESIHIDFEVALPGSIVESVDLTAGRPVASYVAIITALAAPLTH